MDIETIRRGVLAAAIADLEQCPAEAAMCRDHRSDRQEIVHRAALAVLATSPAVATIAAEIDTLQKTLTSKATALAWLIDQGLVATETEGQGMTLAGVVAARWRQIGHGWQDLGREASGAAVWIEALEALQSDPIAPIPQRI